MNYKFLKKSYNELMKLVFMGTPEYAVPSLKAIYDNFSQSLVAVFTRPDKTQGRNLKLKETPVKNFAFTHKLPVYTPETKNELAEQIKTLNPDVIVIIAYGMLIPQEITDNYFCLNLHGSLLPKYRGASPIQASLLNHDQKTGVTLMKINEKLDAGPTIILEEEQILPEDNFGTLAEKLAKKSARVILDFLIKYDKNKAIDFQIQNEAAACYCTKITKDDLNLNLANSPEEFIAKVKAFAPKPGAFLTSGGNRYKILDVQLIDGKIEILKIQPEGKQPMAYRDFLLGHKKGLDFKLF